MTVRHALSLWALIGGTFALEHGGYRIIANRQSSAKRDLGFEVDTNDVSFDGSLQDLYQLAAEKAKEDAAVDSPSSVTSPTASSPVTASPTAGVNVTVSPVTAAPTTLAPLSSAPTTKALVSASPVTETPTSPSPTSQAPTSALSTTRAPTSKSPTTVSSTKPISSANKTTVIDCETAYDSVDEISFRYAMEYESNYDITDLLAALEPMMNSHIAMILLPCDVSHASRRYLADDVGLVALDSNPVDYVDTTGFCGATFKRNTCRVVEGQMRYFVGSGGDRIAAEFDVRVEVKNYLNSVIVIPGLYATKYLGPDIEKPAAEVNTGNPGDVGRFSGPESNNTLSSRSIVLFAFAGVAFVVSIGVAFWFRRHKDRRANRDNMISGESEVTVTKEASQVVLNIDTMDSGSNEDNETLSPFSKMLPAAYRLDDGQADMSVILESVEGSSTNDRGSSILLSEGYTTDEGESDGVDTSHLNFSNYSSAPVLGAKPRGEIQPLVDV